MIKIIYKNNYMISGYGLENLILEEASLSKYLPLIPYYDHGWSLSDGLRKSIIDNPSKEHFAWNNRVVKIHSKLNKKFYVTGSPFIFYINKHSIKKKKNFNTIFFLSHSTPKINQELDFNKLFDILENIDENLKPVDICLHYYDLEFKDIFEKNGFRVRTAGKVNNDDYPKYFFDILSDYSYSCSNVLGSYVLYSLYLNIPFFLVGEEPVFDNFAGDKNVPRIFKISDSKASSKYYPLFKKFEKSITDEQKKMMELELGLHDKIPNSLLRNIILDSLKRSILNPLESLPLLRSLARTGFMKYKSLI